MVLVDADSLCAIKVEHVISDPREEVPACLSVVLFRLLESLF
jgi:hypothetical protein